ncbi:uncharacterized protein SCHCODRAFT_02747669 [Schizophyllum commune H4-8]|nr:uncharacterized protein SCHCODRAFT_02747669 [Schizophyllum commune H4-8]KAI5893722.1 hypothetical protein SCHCODRAFT_02747669 [Schizophyllum commune H4-8]
MPNTVTELQSNIVTVLGATAPNAPANGSQRPKGKRPSRRKPKANKGEEMPAQDAPAKKVKKLRNKAAEKEDAPHDPAVPRDFGIVGRAAKAAVAAVEKIGFPAAVFGSMACGLYGNKRRPNDVDILICVPPDSGLIAEDIKRKILDVNPRNFFLKLPRDPANTYRKLYYRDEYMGPECKVDILIPGTLMLPLLAPSQITRIDDIPVVPFSVLLLQKLQGWDDHGREEQGFKRTKQQTDEGDLRRMMGLAAARALAAGVLPWDDKALFPAEFMQLSRERVIAYSKKFPDRAAWWEKLGFVTKAPETGPTKEDASANGKATTVDAVNDATEPTQA